MQSSLPRVLEPEVMDTAEEADAYDAMDHAEVNRAFVERFVELGGARAGAVVLDVGTGPAHQPVELARRAPGCRVIGVDAAAHMLRHGGRRVREAGLASRVTLVRTDAKRLPFADRSLGAVMSNSIVHHLPDPVPALREMRRVVADRGAVLLRDLRRPHDRVELERLVALHAAGADERQRGLFRDSLHAAFTPDEIAALLEAAGLRDLRVYASSDRHWTAERAAWENA